MISWHKLNKMYKADIIEMFRSSSFILNLRLINDVQSKFMYPADKDFDKRVLKHIAKHFKQYKHDLKRDYSKLEEKTKEDMYEIVPKGHSHDGWMLSCTSFANSLSYNWLYQLHRKVETHGREPTHLEFFKETHRKEGGGFVVNTTTEGFLNKASSKVQERLLSSSTSKNQVEIENEVFDELLYEEENTKRPIGFHFNVDRSDVFGVNVVLRKRGYNFPDNNMKLKRVKEELAS
ncbi:hypothetical protein Cgig2_007590 [Carnegiea gigantea]|uniref:Uncharacterized protein n=1 Tax=Carnegiea gigantea TaxID=171969 RepID=A0A9Q1JZN6_9CARY|nr:hypothetical protein Cgig2_007590 [Carnegiea gigantea]